MVEEDFDGIESTKDLYEKLYTKQIEKFFSVQE